MPVEVKRTLVKSPPELWAELSDPASLARHLGEFGEIRTVRVEPETTVEWEAQDVRGTVEIKPSGWGTKVTLSVVRETPEPEPAPQLLPAVIGPAALAPKPKPEAEPKDDPKAELEPASEPESAALEIEPEPWQQSRRGFFARLFGRRRRERRDLASAEPVLLTPAGPASVVEDEPAGPVATEPVTTEPESIPEPAPQSELAMQPEPIPDLAAELAAVEETMSQQDAALLSAVLDRLGAAHHRPFSRG